MCVAGPSRGVSLHCTAGGSEGGVARCLLCQSGMEYIAYQLTRFFDMEWLNKNVMGLTKLLFRKSFRILSGSGGGVQLVGQLGAPNFRSTKGGQRDRKRNFTPPPPPLSVLTRPASLENPRPLQAALRHPSVRDGGVSPIAVHLCGCMLAKTAWCLPSCEHTC